MHLLRAPQTDPHSQDEDKDTGAEVLAGSAVRFYVNGADCGDAFTDVQVPPPPGPRRTRRTGRGGGRRGETGAARRGG